MGADGGWSYVQLVFITSLSYVTTDARQSMKSIDNDWGHPLAKIQSKRSQWPSAEKFAKNNHGHAMLYDTAQNDVEQGT